MVRAWTDAGAAVYVCGSLQGMAGGVDEARDILGDARLQQLLHDGRYRRDVLKRRARACRPRATPPRYALIAA